MQQVTVTVEKRDEQGKVVEITTTKTRTEEASAPEQDHAKLLAKHDIHRFHTLSMMQALQVIGPLR